VDGPQRAQSGSRIAKEESDKCISDEKLGRLDEARAEFERAASLTRNARERPLLLERAGRCAGTPGEMR
jgi:hypothetical protein